MSVYEPESHCGPKHWSAPHNISYYPNEFSMSCGLKQHKVLFVSTLWRLTNWDHVTHIMVGNLTIIGSDKRHGIIWTNAGIMLIRPLGTNFSEILIKMHTFSFNKKHLNMSDKQRPVCLGLNVSNSALICSAWQVTCKDHSKVLAHACEPQLGSKLSMGLVLLLWYDVVNSLVANGSAAHRKLCCHWLKGLQQCQVAVEIKVWGPWPTFLGC